MEYDHTAKDYQFGKFNIKEIAFLETSAGRYEVWLLTEEVHFFRISCSIQFRQENGETFLIIS